MEPAQPIDYIVVALDGTKTTERILTPAKDLARLYGAGLVLVRALDRDNLPPADEPGSTSNVALAAGPAPDGTGGLDLPIAGAAPGEERAAVRVNENYDAAGYLNILDNTLEAEGFIVEHVDPDDSAADAIIHEAVSRRARLIVMGTRQRKGWDRLFKGSTAEKVLRESPCPILVIPLD